VVWHAHPEAAGGEHLASMPLVHAPGPHLLSHRRPPGATPPQSHAFIPNVCAHAGAVAAPPCTRPRRQACKHRTFQARKSGCRTQNTLLVVLKMSLSAAECGFGCGSGWVCRREGIRVGAAAARGSVIKCASGAAAADPCTSHGEGAQHV